MIRTTLALCVAALLASPGIAQNKAHVRSYDIDVMTSRELVGPEWPDRLALVAAADNDQKNQGIEASYGISPDLMIELLRTSVMPDAWEEDGTWARHQGGRLWVGSRKKELLDRVGTALAELEAAIHRPLTVEVHRVPASTKLRPGAMDARTASALLDGGSHPVGHLQVLPRIRSALSVGTLGSFLADYDVEVASDAQIADPRVIALQDGQDVAIECHPTPGGRIVVRAVCRISDLLDLKRHPVQSTTVGVVQIPVVRTMIAAGSGSLENGGALALGMGEADSDSLIVLRVRTEGQGVGRMGRTRVVPVGAAQSGSLRLRQINLPGPQGSGSSDRMADHPEEPSVLEIDALMDYIRESSGGDDWDEGRAFMSYASGHLFVGPGEVGDAVAKEVSSLQSPYLRTIGLEMRIARMSNQEAGKLLTAGEDELQAVANKTKTVAYASALPGDDIRVVLGRETHYLKDHDVEIAQESTIADPIVGTLFTGQALSGRFRLGSGDRLGFQGEFLAQLPVGHVVSFDGSADDVGVIDLPKTTTWRQPLNATLRSGGWSLLGIAPLPAKDTSLVVLTRVTK